MLTDSQLSLRRSQPVEVDSGLLQGGAHMHRAAAGLLDAIFSVSGSAHVVLGWSHRGQVSRSTR